MNAQGKKLLFTIIWVIAVGGMIYGFNAYWKAWQKGFVVASAPVVTAGASLTIKIREIPLDKGTLAMIFDATDYEYRCELWDDQGRMLSSAIFRRDSQNRQPVEIVPVTLANGDVEYHVHLGLAKEVIAIYRQGEWQMEGWLRYP